MPGGLDIYKRVCTLMGLILNESLRGKKKKHLPLSAKWNGLSSMYQAVQNVLTSFNHRRFYLESTYLCGFILLFWVFLVGMSTSMNKAFMSLTFF